MSHILSKKQYEIITKWYSNYQNNPKALFKDEHAISGSRRSLIRSRFREGKMKVENETIFFFLRREL
jgi:hypothetical protein